MADVSGPVSTLPGSFHPVKADFKCDVHSDRIAIANVQGETDSMGAE